MTFPGKFSQCPRSIKLSSHGMPGIRWRNLLGIYNLVHYDTDKNGVYKHTLKNTVAGDFFLYRTTNIARKHDAWIVSCIFFYQLVTIFSLNCYINFVLVLQQMKFSVR